MTETPTPTREEAIAIVNRVWADHGMSDADRQALRSFLTAQQGEPVAWRYRFEPDLQWHVVEYHDQIPAALLWPKLEKEPLFASPVGSLGSDADRNATSAAGTPANGERFNGYVCRLGWQCVDEGSMREAFTATIEFDAPPSLPIDVVWKRAPVVLEITSPKSDGTEPAATGQNVTSEPQNPTVSVSPTPIDWTKVDAAIGGSYELPDGRKFWMDYVAVQAIIARLRTALQPERSDG